MVNTRFEAYKIVREIKRIGRNFEFKRNAKNEFGEPDKEQHSVITQIKGLYHEQNSNIQITTGDTTQTRTKKIPMILCLYENIIDEFGPLLAVNDYITFNDKTYKVTGVVNIQEWNLIADISLELVDNVV